MSAAPAVENDPEFQAGIHAIVTQLQAQGASKEHISQTVQKAIEYYKQRNADVPEEANAATAEEPEPARKEPYPASFAAIVELLATGREDQIPGIREIPLKIHDQPPSESTMTRPPKPWESHATASQRSGGA
ncbi:hypothetical protein MEQU1_002954 [Malassezia equina]|uniref:Peroxisomal membrane protein PEX14-like KPWE domain-containing protein n=1 Tax=Malassezia equina TaxID=1381935 RepID=A0AAF0ELB8_9BASI|nr:hypothetical protein MEQU1_002954 [Malassezia equina]